MKATDSTVKEVLNYIEKNSSYVFMYADGVKQKLSTPVSIQLKDKKMDAILAELCNKAGLNYKISGRQVTISTGNAKAATPTSAAKVTGQILDENGRRTE